MVFGVGDCGGEAAWAIISLMTAQQVTRDTLSTTPRPRLKAVLNEVMPKEIWVVYCHISAGRSVHPSFRFSLDRAGRLYFVERSRKNKNHEVPFDNPLPSAPTASLSQDQLTTIEQHLDNVGFFGHPGYEARDSRDGSYDVVRVRRGDVVQTVAYRNVANPLVDMLRQVAQSLR